MRFFIRSFKNNAVFWLSGILAVISCFFVRPDGHYVDYINFRVLAILFGLMLIVSELVRIGSFAKLTTGLLKGVRLPRSLSLLLIVLAFFMSMFLTNDVCLVTLVPFAIMVLQKLKDPKNLMYTLILMTVAANLGSMQTPIGNPQNLYLYATYGIGLGDFILTMLPYSLLSLILIIILTFVLIKNDRADLSGNADISDNTKISIPKLIICIALFLLNILTVIGVVSYIPAVLITAAVIAVTDIRAFKKVDYQLLLTFVFFFVLIGNLGRLEGLTDVLSGIVSKRPVETAILSSQIISNVPAAMLLSAFTDKGKDLLIGTNLGGLGTIIASMASLITYKFHNALKSSEGNSSKSGKEKGAGYLPAFTVINVWMLLILYAAFVILSRAGG